MQRNFRNHLILFTDGYLEYSKTQFNTNNYFSTPQIERIRNAANADGISVQEVLKQHPEYGIPPMMNEVNKLIELYVLETVDRNFSVEKGINGYANNVTDAVILEAAWRDWAMKSGFKNFVWRAHNLNERINRKYFSDLFKR